MINSTDLLSRFAAANKSVCAWGSYAAWNIFRILTYIALHANKCALKRKILLKLSLMKETENKQKTTQKIVKATELNKENRRKNN